MLTRLTASALTLALIVPAAPAFASGHESEHHQQPVSHPEHSQHAGSSQSRLGSAGRLGLAALGAAAVGRGWQRATRRYRSLRAGGRWATGMIAGTGLVVWDQAREHLPHVFEGATGVGATVMIGATTLLAVNRVGDRFMTAAEREAPIGGFLQRRAERRAAKLEASAAQTQSAAKLPRARRHYVKAVMAKVGALSNTVGSALFSHGNMTQNGTLMAIGAGLAAPGMAAQVYSTSMASIEHDPSEPGWYGSWGALGGVALATLNTVGGGLIGAAVGSDPNLMAVGGGTLMSGGGLAVSGLIDKARLNTAHKADQQSVDEAN